MEKQTVVLRLRGDVVPVWDAHGRGLRREGETRFAQSPAQNKILEQLLRQAYTPEALVKLLCPSDPGGEEENTASLALAEFILDFGEFLEKQ